MGQSQMMTRAAGWLLGAPGHLPNLPDVEDLAPGCVRVLGQNPSPFTLQGTNTYLLGTGTDRLLVDTSDGNGYWWPMLSNLLVQASARISMIVLTHGHFDHTGGLSAVREVFPDARVFKYLSKHVDQGLVDRAAQADLPEQHYAGSLDVVAEAEVPPPPLPLTGEGEIRPQRMLTARGQTSKLITGSHTQSRQVCWCDGEVPSDCEPLEQDQVLRVEGIALRVIHTPGHSEDSVCFELEPEGNPTGAPAYLTGDTILGGTSTMFLDLNAYRNSLRILHEKLEERPVSLYPGHGATVAAARAADCVASMLRSLRQRDRAIEEFLRRQDECCTVGEICSGIYGDGAEAYMASSIIQLHVDGLVTQGHVKESASWLSGAKYYETCMRS